MRMVILSFLLSIQLYTKAQNYVEVNDTLHLNTNTVYTNTEFQFHTGAVMLIDSGITVLINHCQLYSCDTFMWCGIVLKNHAALRIQNSQISDAQYAVQLADGVFFQCRKNVFDRNFIGIYAPPSGIPKSITPVSGIQGNLFDCSSALKQGYDQMTTAYPSQPHISGVLAERWAWAGIHLNDVAMIAIGKNPSALTNTFMHMANGIITKRTNLTVANSNFQSLPVPGHLTAYHNMIPYGPQTRMDNGKAIWADGSNGNYYLSIEKGVRIAGCHYGVDARNGMNLNVPKWGMPILNSLNGIVVNNCRDRVIVIEHCDIELDGSTDMGIANLLAVRYVGVQVNTSRATSGNGYIKIDHENHITINEATQSLGIGISINDQLMFNGTPLNVTGNSVYMNHGVTGIKINGINGATVYQNRVWLNYKDYNRNGIQITNSSGLKVVNNTVSGTGATEGPINNSFYPRGMYLQSTATAIFPNDHNNITCNRLYDLRTGLRIEGTCDNTNFERNDMGWNDNGSPHDNFFGVHVTNMAKFGLQPDQSGLSVGTANLNWNKWFGNYTYSGNGISYLEPAGSTVNLTGLAAWNANVDPIIGGGWTSNPNYNLISYSTVTVPPSTSFSGLYTPPTRLPNNNNPAWINELSPVITILNVDDGCTPAPPALANDNGNDKKLKLSEGDIEVLRHLYNPGMYKNVQKWVEEKRVYSKLKDREDSIPGYGEVRAFFDSLESGGIDLFKQVDELKARTAEMDSIDIAYLAAQEEIRKVLKLEIEARDSALNLIAQDSVNQIMLLDSNVNPIQLELDSLMNLLAQVQKNIADRQTMIDQKKGEKADEAKDKNEEITATQYYEDFKKQTDAIYLNTLARGIGQFDSADEARLRYIAAQCFLAAGDAVFDARAMIALVEDKSYDDYDICMEQGYAMKTEETTQPVTRNPQPATIAYHLFPNPASNEVKVLKIGATYDYEQFEVYDVLGKAVLLQNTGSEKNVVLLNISKLAMGNYVLRVMKDGEKVYQQTFSILK